MTAPPYLYRIEVRLCLSRPLCKHLLPRLQIQVHGQAILVPKKPVSLLWSLGRLEPEPLTERALECPPLRREKRLVGTAEQPTTAPGEQPQPGRHRQSSHRRYRLSPCLHLWGAAIEVPRCISRFLLSPPRLIPLHSNIGLSAQNSAGLNRLVCRFPLATWYNVTV
jgi:hypothetical protein